MPGNKRHSPLTPLIYHLYPIWSNVIFFFHLLFFYSLVFFSLTVVFTSVLSFFFCLMQISAVALAHSPWTDGELPRHAASLSALSHHVRGSPWGCLFANMQMSCCPSNDSDAKLHLPLKGGGSRSSLLSSIKLLYKQKFSPMDFPKSHPLIFIA